MELEGLSYVVTDMVEEEVLDVTTDTVGEDISWTSQTVQWEKNSWEVRQGQ